MPAYTIVVLIALVVIGAIIAWAGDAIGTRLGKQRASIFGLRPRQSARLVAVIIGGVLPLVGLGVATAGSEYARIAVFRLQSLLRRERELEARVEEQTQAARQARRDAREERERAQNLKELSENLEGQVAELRDREAGLRARVQELEGRKRELERKNEELERRVKEAEQKLKEAEQKLKESEEKLKESEEKLKQAEQEREALELTNEQLRQERDRLVVERDSFLAERDDARRESEEARVDVEASRARLQSVRAELASVEEDYRRYRQRQRAIAGDPALFEPDDELIRVVLSADQTQDQMEGELWELLHFASPVAEARGVPVGANGRAIVVVAPVPPGVDTAEVPERLIVRYFASELRQAGEEEYVVVVWALRRLYPEDDTQLEVRFLADPNRLKFSKGEVLVETRIPAQWSRVDILETLWRLIADQERSQVRAVARAKGVLPNPKTGQYGAFSLADMFNAPDEIRALEGIVPVRVVAAEDTYTAGPLMVEIEVGPREGP